MAASPSLLIADEPTTGLDVTTQAIIMDIIAERAAASGMATVFITHDLGLAAERADRIVVMHAGHVVEIASTKDIFARPRHPYTAELLAATPTAASTLESLRTIAGGLPDLRRTDLPGCRFAERCRLRAPACDGALPMIEPGAAVGAACHRPLEPPAATATRRRATER